LRTPFYFDGPVAKSFLPDHSGVPEAMMQVEFPGVMTPFSQVAVGDCCLYFTEGEQKPDVGMKITVEGTAALLSLTTAVHPSMTAPTVLQGKLFENSHVCVLRDAKVRPSYDPQRIGKGQLSVNSPGPIIFANRVAYIRAWWNPGTIDVNLSDGSTVRPQSHVDPIWVEDWVVLLPTANGEQVLCQRGKPRATAEAASMRVR
jgi:hypothetical protein